MVSIATITLDPKPASCEHGPRNDPGELRDTNPTRDHSETPPQYEVHERTDYSYDADDDWINMHLDKKMEENY